MIQVNIFEAKTNLSKLITSLENRTNDSIIVARNGKPVAKIIPFQTEQDKKHFLNAGAGQFTLPPAHVLESLDNEILSDFEQEDIL